MIVDFFNGKFGLARTYWFGVFGVGVLGRAVNKVITHGYLTAETDAAYEQIELWHVAFAVLIGLYGVLMVRAMLKAGFDNRRPGGWGWIGIALTSVGACYGAYVAITLLFPNVTTPRILVERELSELNKILPQKMDEDLTMQQVALVGDDMTYFVSANFSVAEVDRYLVENAVSISTPDGQELCEDFQGYFKGGIERIVYEFSYTDDVIRAVLTAEECFDWLSN